MTWLESRSFVKYIAARACRGPEIEGKVAPVTTGLMVDLKCPLWVIRGHHTNRGPGPLRARSEHSLPSKRGAGSRPDQVISGCISTGGLPRPVDRSPSP